MSVEYIYLGSSIFFIVSVTCVSCKKGKKIEMIFSDSEDFNLP